MGSCCSAEPSAQYERVPLHNPDRPGRAPSGQVSGPTPEELALLVRFYLRSLAGLTLQSALPDIGARARKHYFSVAQAGGGPVLLTLVARPRECALALEREGTRFAFQQLLTGVRSHFVYPTLGADYLEERRMAVVWRPLQPKGSLRDLVFGSKWQQPYDHKYATRRGTPFSETRVCTWGRHVLEGILALRLKGFPAGHVHAGNVIVDDGVCRITDYENKLLNVAPAHLGLLQSPALAARGLDPDVVCFGALVFEMCTGFIMDTVDLVRAPQGLPPALAAVLHSIFYAGPDTPAPTLETLVVGEPFCSVRMPDLAPLPRVRYGARAKEVLQEARRASVLGGADVRKAPRPPAKPAVYQDTPLATTSYQQGSKPAEPVVVPATAAVTAPIAAPAIAAAPKAPAPKAAAPAPAPKAAAPAPAPKAAAPAAPAPPAVPAAPKAAGGAPPPPPPPGPPPPGPPAPPPPAPRPSNAGRGGLLSSIEGFSKGKLKKAVTVDKSKPLLKP